VLARGCPRRERFGGSRCARSEGSRLRTLRSSLARAPGVRVASAEELAVASVPDGGEGPWPAGESGARRPISRARGARLEIPCTRASR
jgi:hypothetical protein